MSGIGPAEEDAAAAAAPGLLELLLPSAIAKWRERKLVALVRRSSPFLQAEEEEERRKREGKSSLALSLRFA